MAFTQLGKDRMTREFVSGANQTRIAMHADEKGYSKFLDDSIKED